MEKKVESYDLRIENGKMRIIFVEDGLLQKHTGKTKAMEMIEKWNNGEYHSRIMLAIFDIAACFEGIEMTVSFKDLGTLKTTLEHEEVMRSIDETRASFKRAMQRKIEKELKLVTRAFDADQIKELEQFNEFRKEAMRKLDKKKKETEKLKAELEENLEVFYEKVKKNREEVKLASNKKEDKDKERDSQSKEIKKEFMKQSTEFDDVLETIARAINFIDELDIMIMICQGSEDKNKGVVITDIEKEWYVQYRAIRFLFKQVSNCINQAVMKAFADRKEHIVWRTSDGWIADHRLIFYFNRKYKMQLEDYTGELSSKIEVEQEELMEFLKKYYSKEQPKMIKDLVDRKEPAQIVKELLAEKAKRM